MDHRVTQQIEIPITIDPLVYDDGKVHISGTWAVPQTEPCAPKVQCWVRRERMERPDVLAGHRGRWDMSWGDWEGSADWPSGMKAAADRIRFLAFDFWNQRPLGIVEAGTALDLGTMAPRANRLIRLAPWDSTTAVLAGTDLHFSGGGVKVSRWQTTADSVKGEVDTRWPAPVRLTVAFPSQEGYVTAQATVEPGEHIFRIKRPGERT